MKKALGIIAILVFTFTQSKSQDKPNSLNKGEQVSVSDHLIKIETGLPSLVGLSYEKKLNQNISLYNSISLLGAFGGGSFSRTFYGVDNYYLLTPQIKMQPRLYHNLGMRAIKGKNVNFNAANYLGLSASFYHTSFFLTNAQAFPQGPAVLDVQLAYGIQRIFFKKFNIDLAFEPGLEFTQGEIGAFIGLNLQLGVVVFSN
ncbi:hypothetical protein [uncultured Marivirga sp.]|uniref:hypothetical protein n=1 Tax=uncultured Marivirga sp. TaxID=1123707 RepID=UPI0030EFA35D|tara:strand:+ start:144445 stop:145047 length:603 start_codon:yes stop_codon:yes gene_type:complete